MAGVKEPQPEIGRVPLNEPEMEQLVLGAAMLEAGTVDELNFLQPEHFYVTAHQQVWKAIVAVHDTGAHPDIALVSMQLKKMGVLDEVGGPFYISQLTNKVAASANAEYHARMVVQCWVNRRLGDITGEYLRRSYDPQEDVFELADGLTAAIDSVLEVTKKQPSISMEELAKEELQKMDQPTAPPHKTGYKSLDDFLGGGFLPADFWVVSARPGMGKSAFAIGSSVHSAMSGSKPSLFFELELVRRVANIRALAAYGGFRVHDLLSRKISVEEMTRLHEVYPSFSKLPLYWNFSEAATIDDIRRETARHIRRYDIGCVFIDQANWIKRPSYKDQNKEHEHITRNLRRIAKEFNIPVVLLHQMNREITGRTGHRPRLSDLKQSGSYEEDPQGVIFVHRPEYYGDTEDEFGPTAGRADIIIAKHSNGPVGTVHLRMDKESTCFVDDWNSVSQPPPMKPPTTKPPRDFTSPASADDDLPF